MYTSELDKTPCPHRGDIPVRADRWCHAKQYWSLRQKVNFSILLIAGFFILHFGFWKYCIKIFILILFLCLRHIFLPSSPGHETDAGRCMLGLKSTAHISPLRPMHPFFPAAESADSSEPDPKHCLQTLRALVQGHALSPETVCIQWFINEESPEYQRPDEKVQLPDRRWEQISHWTARSEQQAGRRMHRELWKWLESQDARSTYTMFSKCGPLTSGISVM